MKPGGGQLAVDGVELQADLHLPLLEQHEAHRLQRRDGEPRFDGHPCQAEGWGTGVWTARLKILPRQPPRPRLVYSGHWGGDRQDEGDNGHDQIHEYDPGGSEAGKTWLLTPPHQESPDNWTWLEPKTANSAKNPSVFDPKSELGNPFSPILHH